MINPNRIKKKSFTQLSWYLLFFLLLISYSEMTSQEIDNKNLSSEDIKQIREINRNYTQGWLENDSKKVLGLFTD